MKFTKFFIFLILITSCTKTNKQENSKTKGDKILEDIGLLENKEFKTPIITFKDFAKSNAEESIKLTKKNIISSLAKAKKHKHCVIIVGTHTIVKILDLKKCKQSGSWKACMPFAEGYIKKKGLKYQKDYINNIIGVPDNQERTMYLFS